jgi:hypothetical protein
MFAVKRGADRNGMAMPRKPALLAAMSVTCLAGILGAGGAAWAGGGGVPAPAANCLGKANSGGANGAFIRAIATSGAGGAGSLAMGFGTSGGAGVPASTNNCSG